MGSRPDVAFVFSGGANLGAVQVGMARALGEAGVRPDLLIGASVGAINAALLAFDPSPTQVERLAAGGKALRRRDIFPGCTLGRTWRLLRGSDHLVSNRALLATIRQWLPDDDLAATVIPLHVVTTELGTGQERWRTGPLHQILLASSSIPGISHPVMLDGSLHVDGAVTQTVPTSRGPTWRSSGLCVGHGTPTHRRSTAVGVGGGPSGRSCGTPDPSPTLTLTVSQAIPTSPSSRRRTSATSTSATGIENFSSRPGMQQPERP